MCPSLLAWTGGGGDGGPQPVGASDVGFVRSLVEAVVRGGNVTVQAGGGVVLRPHQSGLTPPAM